MNDAQNKVQDGWTVRVVLTQVVVPIAAAIVSALTTVYFSAQPAVENAATPAVRDEIRAQGKVINDLIVTLGAKVGRLEEKLSEVELDAAMVPLAWGNTQDPQNNNKHTHSEKIEDELEPVESNRFNILTKLPADGNYSILCSVDQGFAYAKLIEKKHEGKFAVFQITSFKPTSDRNPGPLDTYSNPRVFYMILGREE